MSKLNIERSREIRQWLNLVFKAIGGFISVDLLFNNGQATDKIIQSAKNKVASVRSRLGRKESSDVINL